MRGQEVFSFSSLGHMLAAGSTGEVLFWDRRQGSGSRTLAKLDDTHMEDVTQASSAAGGGGSRGLGEGGMGRRTGWQAWDGRAWGKRGARGMGKGGLEKLARARHGGCG